MAPVVVKGLAVAFACGLGQVMALDPPCAIYGQGYNDPQRNETPNGGFPNSSKACQELCVNQTYCDRFTFYNNTNGCWLQGDHEDSTIESPYAISGPVKCLADKNASGGFQWWMGLLIFVLVVCIGGIAWYFMGGSSEKKKKKKTTSKDAPDVEERAALVAAGDAAPASAALLSQSAVFPQAAPVYYAQPAQAAPVYYTSQAAVPAMTYMSSVVAPPQYVQTSGRQVMMSVAQPAQAPDDLFNRFDTDGDGVLSREELEAGVASLQQR